MFLKIMGKEDAPDDDSRKTFTLHSHVASTTFVRRGGGVIAEVVFDDDSNEDFDVPKNAYLMNEAGETVASFGSAGYRRTAA